MTRANAPVRYDIAYRGRPGEFIARISHIPNLTQEEEVAYITAWQERRDARAMEALLGAYQKFIVKTFRKTLGQKEFEDALQAGNEAFIRSVTNFDLSRGFRLSTYANWNIKEAVQSLHSHVLVAVITTADRKKVAFNVNKTLGKITGGTRDPLYADFEKASKIMGVSIKDTVEVYEYLRRGDAPLDAPLSSESNKTRQDLIADKSDSPEDIVANMDEVNRTRATLYRALTVLNREGLEREKEVFYARRLQEPAPTLEALAATFNLSRERVRQLEVRAFKLVCNEVKRLQKAPRTEESRFGKFMERVLRPVSLDA